MFEQQIGQQAHITVTLSLCNYWHNQSTKQTLSHTLMFTVQKMTA